MDLATGEAGTTLRHDEEHRLIQYQWIWMVYCQSKLLEEETINNFTRVWLAENWRRRGKFEEVAFIFPNAPQIPITIVLYFLGSLLEYKLIKS